jgi:NADP-dependent 3-hydroxy acid dehydrogenase YdfG
VGSSQGTLAGRVIVIAGASSGMGRATARVLANAGATLVLAARSGDALEAVAAEIAGAGGQASTVVADVVDRDEAAGVVQTALDRHGKIDALINSVGTNIPRRTLPELTAESWRELIDVNLTAAFNLTQAVIPALRANGGGQLVHISSSAAKRADASGVGYQASKAGVAALAHAASEEERANNIRVSVIFPGMTDTPLVLKRPAPTPPEVLAKALQPDDIAAACLFILSLPPRAWVPELLLYPSGL